MKLKKYTGPIKKANSLGVLIALCLAIVEYLSETLIIDLSE